VVVARRLILVLVVLTALGGSAAYYTTEMRLTGTEQQARNLGWIVFALMTGLSILLAVLIWQSLSSSYRKIRQQLKQWEAEEEIGLIMIDEKDELADLVACINQYLTGIKSRMRKHRLQQKELEIQARVSEAERRQTEAMIFSISEAILVTDKFDELLMANPAAETLFGFQLEDSYRRPVDVIIQNENLMGLIRQARQNKSPKLMRLLEWPDPEQNRILSLKVLLSCVLDTKQEGIGVVVVIHDVTAEKEIATMKDDFVSSVSHELKTPLASIRAYAEMLADNEADNSQAYRQFCDIIQEQAQRLNRLIDNILNSSRLESGVLKVSKEKLNSVEIVNHVITTMQPQAQEKNIELCRQSETEEMWIVADRDMIHQAVMNLVSNALKYSPPNQTVRVRQYLQNNRQGAIEIQDHGAGIPDDNLEKIFDKFYRVQKNNHLAGGTGLGLHLVRQIIENIHDGRIAVESQPGKGSTFTIVLPLCQIPQLQTA
jgi:two-component system, OmpR family, phosphate regulon sensor histidine kinase PhoR